MKLSIVCTLAVVCVLPFAHAIILLDGGTSAATTTIGWSLGTAGSTSAATAAAATVAGVGVVAAALVVGGLALAAATNNRRKRSPASLCMPVEDPEVFLTLAANSDKFGCGLRLVCELEASSDDSLTQEEMLILSLFGRQVKPVAFSELKNAKSGFQYAALVGSQAKSVSECAQVFDQCPFDKTTIMEAFNTTQNK